MTTHTDMRQGARKHDTRPDAVPETSEFYVMPTSDEWTEDVLGYYVERFWLPIVGPSGLVIMRRLAMYAAAGVPTFHFDTEDFAKSFGLKGPRFMDSIKRMVDFQLMRRDTRYNRIGYALAWPRVPDERSDRWPAWVADEHEQWLRDQVAA